MAEYSGSYKDGVIRNSDRKFIERNKNNPDWLAFLDWQAAGGVLDAPYMTTAEYEWYIDIGPFFDRFGSAKLNVLTSSHPVAKAIVMDCTVRKWIDLKNPAVAAGIDALISIATPGVDSALKDHILNTPVADNERSAVVRLYFTYTNS